MIWIVPYTYILAKRRLISFDSHANETNAHLFCAGIFHFLKSQGKSFINPREA